MIPHVLGKKGKLLFTCHYSPVIIHGYYSLLLFTQKFCLFKGGCPLYSKQVFLVQNFFLKARKVNPSKQVMNIILKLLVIESKIEHL